MGRVRRKCSGSRGLGLVGRSRLTFQGNFFKVTRVAFSSSAPANPQECALLLRLRWALLGLLLTETSGRGHTQREDLQGPSVGICVWASLPCLVATESRTAS